MTTDYSPWGNLRRRVEEAVQYKLRKKDSGLVRLYIALYVDATGTLKGWEEPQCRQLEPIRNWHSDTIANWDELRHKVAAAACKALPSNKRSGLSRIFMVLELDKAGTLLCYEEPKCKRLEPSNINWCNELGG